MLKCAFNNRSFYILGAGASAGIIPFTNEQGEKIVNRHLENGVFSDTEIIIDPIAKRLMGNAYYSDDQLRQELIKRIPSGAVKATSYQLMAAKNNILPPEQYNVFNIAKYKSVIFNFNVDGLANKFCNRHIVLNPHGVLNSEIMHGNEWDEIIETCLTYHLEPPIIHDVLLPQKEPLGITNNNAYNIASKCYPYTEYVVIIGYSFGKNKNNLDDWESYLYFVELFKSNQKPIVVISLDGADELVYMLSEDLLRKNIYAISAYWNYLASAMLESMRINIHFPHVKNKYRISLEYIYQSILDNKA